VDEEWRVSLVLRGQSARRKPFSAHAVRSQLRSRVGGEVSVTGGEAGIFLYTATEDAAAAAEGVAREVLARQRLTADIQVEQWDPSCRAWLSPGVAAAAELPSGQERDPGHARLRAAGAVLAAIIEGMGAGGL
jgi:hypothetical protein